MEVEPSALTYKGTFIEPLTEHLTLTNTTDEPLAFKVKTTAPKLYCVRPNASIIAPGESTKISVILQGYTTPLPRDFKCKDKFLIVSCPSADFTDASKVAENWATLYKQHGQNGAQKKLRVNFIVEDDGREDTRINDTTFANATQNTVADNTSAYDADTTAANAPPQDHSVLAANPDRTLQDTTILPTEANDTISEKVSAQAELQSDLDASNTKIHTLSEKLDSTERAGEQKTVVSPQETVSGVSLPFAAILVIIALLLGWYIF